MAQSSFTIVRPANGAKVRENVRLLFPMNSVGDGGYVGIYIGGKFLEAVTPGKGQQYLYYDLDTKARGIPDGPLTIEAVLFQDFADRPRIVDRSSIQVTVANSSSIPVPEGGIKMRYKFSPGKQWVYRYDARVAVNNLSEVNANSMTTENLLAGAETSTVRLLYAVDNAYGNGDGLLRIQGMTDPGKDSVDLVTEDSPDAARTFYDYQMHPLYMRVQGTGREVFGSAPTYFPLSGTRGESFRTDLYALFPLPILPEGAKRPGDSWQTGIQLGDLDLDKKDEAKSLVFTVPDVRAEFVGVEWESNHPCAHLKYLRGDKLPEGIKTGGRLVNAQRVQEDIYFALDLGAVLKLVRTYTIDTKIKVPVGGGSSGGGGNAPGAGIGGGTGAPKGGPTGVGGGVGGGSRGGGPGGVGSGIVLPPPTLGGGTPFNQGRRGGPGGGPQGGGGPQLGGVSQQGGAPGGLGGGDNFGRGGRTGGETTRVVRLTVQQMFTLEK